MVDLPKPPVPAGVDLHDFSFTPIFRTQLFRSAFHARATDAEWRAGVTLWLKSWDQMPAGSLPDDDVELCRLAEFGRDQKGWKRVKNMALYGWYLCDDGRLYHRVVTEGVMAAYVRRRAASDKGKAGAKQRWNVIEGGAGNAPANARANAPAIQLLMPGDSNREGEGQGDREGHKNQEGETVSPDGLDRDAWKRFVAYRKEIGKAYKPASLAAAMRRLAAYGEHQAAVVEQTVANGWQGLYDLKSRPNGAEERGGKFDRKTNTLRDSELGQH